jgi:FAD/FMN-containing dehydrogenase
VVIDLRRLDRIRVDDDGLVAVGGGAVWGAVADALAPHRLAISSGDTASVGVGGLTLGGGIGWLVRANGLAIDHLVGAEVVTAAGAVVRASADEHADLFWAIRGGGGNVGIVTEFVFRARPLPGVVHAHLEFDPAQLGSVLRALRDDLRRAPDEWTANLVALPPFGPEMPPSLHVEIVWAGEDLDAARAASEALLGHPALRSGKFVPGAYRDLLAGPPPELPGPPPTMVDESDLVGSLDDAVIDRVVAAHEALAPAVMMLRTLGGAYGRVAPDATAFAGRDAEALLISAAFRAPDAAPEQVGAARAVWADAMAGVSVGCYGNFRPSRDARVVDAMYPPAARERLREVKRSWDPGNVFRGNHNVPPR